MTQLTEALRRARPEGRPEALDTRDHPWAVDLDTAAESVETTSMLDSSEPVMPGSATVFDRPEPSDHADIRPLSERAPASPVQRLRRRARQQLSGLIDRVFLPIAAGTVRSVGLAAVGEGVSSTPITAALAELLAQQTRARVCAIDANFASPSLHEEFDTCHPVAMGSEFEPTVPLTQFAYEVRRSLWLLSMAATQMRAAVTTDPTGARMARLIGSFDYVLVDLEPASDDPLASAVVRLVDGVILVIDAEATRPALAQRAVGILKSSGVTILGAVLTNRRYPVPGPIYQRL